MRFLWSLQILYNFPAVRSLSSLHKDFRICSSKLSLQYRKHKKAGLGREQAKGFPI